MLVLQYILYIYIINKFFSVFAIIFFLFFSRMYIYSAKQANTAKFSKNTWCAWNNTAFTAKQYKKYTILQ